MAVEPLGQTSDFASKLLEMVSFESVVLRATNAVRTDSSEVFVPIIGDASADWYLPGSEIDDGQPNGDFVRLVPKGVKTLAVIPNETLDDASIDLGSAVGKKLLSAVGRKIDDGLLNGGGHVPGEDGPIGILNFPHLNSISGPVSYDSLVEAAAAIREAGGEPQWAIISPSSLSDLQRATDGLDRPLLSNDPQAGPVYQAAGLRLLVSPAMASGTGLVFDEAQFVSAIRRDITLEVDASAKFTSDQVAIRVKARVDGAVADPAGFALIQPS